MRDMSQPARHTLDLLSVIFHEQGEAAVLDEAEQILTAAATVLAREGGVDRLMKALVGIALVWDGLDDPPGADQGWGDGPAQLAA